MDDPWTSAASSAAANTSVNSSRQESPLLASKTLLEWACSIASNPDKPSSISKTGFMRILRAGNLTVEQAESIAGIVISDESSITKDDMQLALQLMALAQRNRNISLDELAAGLSEGLDLTPALEGFTSNVNSPSTRIGGLDNMNNLSISENRRDTGASADPWKSTTSVSSDNNNTPLMAPPKIATNAPPYLRNAGVSGTESVEVLWFTGRNPIKVTLLAEKGGLLFKHLNYGLESSVFRSSVVRRYSDFTWLMDVLTKKYPFRLIPPLPPKKIAVGTDDIFIEQRRRGLYRFINFIGNHPVLQNDETVIDFLKVQTEIQTYKKTNQPSTDEEFTMYRDTWGSLITSLPSNIDDKLRLIRDSLGSLQSHYQKWIQTIKEISVSCDELSKSYQSLSNISSNMGSGESCMNCWMNNCGPCGTVKSGFLSTSKHLGSISNCYNKHADVESNDIGDKFSTWADLIQGFHDLFERTEKGVTNNFDPLNKRITANQQKIAALGATSPTSKEFEKLSNQIEVDQREISFHMERNQFAKYCLWTEAQYFHRHRVMVSLIFQQFARGKRDFHAQVFEAFSILTRSVEEMSTDGF